jgi:hypothetical protein
MRESVFFEVKLRRFAVWRAAVCVVAALAVAVVAAWAVATFDSRPVADRALFLGLLAALVVATSAVALSLARVESGVLSCRGGVWSFVADTGAVRQGPLAVAIDLGAFLLLRLRDGRLASTWLPVQRRGLEREWHALRCAVYARPVTAASSTAAPIQRG